MLTIANSQTACLLASISLFLEQQHTNETRSFGQLQPAGTIAPFCRAQQAQHRTHTDSLICLCESLDVFVSDALLGGGTHF